MSMPDQVFSERLGEIDAYLDLLAALEQQVQTGPPRVGAGGPIITATQQRILYSSVYVQLYNLVEATITKCIEAICDAVSKAERWRPSDLSDEFRREWVRYLARTHTDLNYENRLNSSLKMCEHLIQSLPVGELQIERGGGGNWNDEEIFRFANRLGCSLTIRQESNSAVKKPFRNDCGALMLIMRLRNDLAHGSVSFGECGAGITVAELRDLRERTAMYLSDVVSSFQAFIESHAFLQPASRPI
jgi:hypothetical protein